MFDTREAKLRQEVARANEYAEVLDKYIKPFIEEKRVILFQAFQDTPVGQVEALKDIKCQLTAINALESHFKEFINTGKLATKDLES